MSFKIVFTGGGTAGHVTPNLALIELLKQDDCNIAYIGARFSKEEAMINAINIPFYAISCGKLRRYFSWQNFIDPLKIIYGILQAYFLLRKLKAEVIFSKGGFVAFPVVIAARLNKIPVIAHESDLSPGLANILSFPFVDKLCLNFEQTKKHFKNQAKLVVTGTPLRRSLFNGSRLKGLELCQFSNDKPCLLVVGGSQGSKHLNSIIRESLPILSQKYQVIHLCGYRNLDKNLADTPGYFQLEYADSELADLFAVSSIVISRAGANSLYEILALKKPHILIPLPSSVSRGDQIQNAMYFKQQGISVVINEEQLSPAVLISAIEDLWKHVDATILKMQALEIESASMKIIALIKKGLKVTK